MRLACGHLLTCSRKFYNLQTGSTVVRKKDKDAVRAPIVVGLVSTLTLQSAFATKSEGQVLNEIRESPFSCR
jgi:hypothetical protein